MVAAIGRPGGDRPTATFGASALGAPFAGGFSAHEWHYASILHEGAAERLFQARDATGADLGALGLRAGTVMGSFCHLIDIA